MKKMYKMFGAVAIIGLFLLSSVVSTSMAVDLKAKASGPSREELEYQLLVDYLQAEEGLSIAEIDQLVAEALELEATQQKPGLGFLALFFPDPKPVYADRIEIGMMYKIEVKIRNMGRAFLETFKTKVTRITWPIVTDYITTIGMLKWTTRTFQTSLKFQVIPGVKHWTVIQVDYFNDLKEGFLGPLSPGEINNLMVRRI